VRPVVRWINAFRPSDDIDFSISYEMATKTQRSAAIMRRNLKIGKAQIGLLLDPICIDQAFVGDIYSVSYKTKLYPTRACKGEWEDYHKYDECFVSSLVIQGIVVTPRACRKTRRLASRLAKKFGLPYLGSLKF